MESATSLSLSLSSSAFGAGPAALIPTVSSRQRNPSTQVVAMGGGGYRGGSSVDENIIVLRMRIQEMKMSEEEGGKSARSDWMEWEKRYYGDYNEEVCKAVGVLQCYLMNVRPSLGLATLVIVLSSLPISTLVLMFHALHMASAILPAFHPWW